ncbi:MAG: amidohydrolase family protein [Synergistaceae bacterium]|jgi:predicted amidohydrolase YtcJ|nr:amidohydrolase family protein [Synergistaceae bacterium]
MRKKSWFVVMVLFLAALVLSGGCGSSDDTADNVSDDADIVDIYVNGNIYTVDDGFSKASSIVVSGDRILYVGSDDTALNDYENLAARVVDLGGKTVLPGLIENHMHYQSLGQQLGIIDITNKQKDEILEAVRAEAERLGSGKWIYSFGWNQDLWLDLDKQWPTKEDLDAVAPDNPVFLYRVDGHSAWLNSLALDSCEITKDTPEPEGGEIEKIEGELTGILYEIAASEAYAKMPPATDEEKLTSYTNADAAVISYGLTTIVDAGASNADIRVLKNAYRDGKLKVRAYEMLSAGGEAEFIGENGAPVRDLYNAKLSVNAVKVYADGSLGSRTAWLKEPYSDDLKNPDNRGTLVYPSVDDFKAVIKTASDYGFQVGTHAIGDAAVSAALDAYEAAAGADLPSRRFRIEHYSVVQPEDVTRTVELGVIPSIQGYFAPSDMVMAPDRLGPDRINMAYSWRDIIDAGAKIVNGSDAPVEFVNPYNGLFAAVARQNLAGEPEGGWRPGQKITREEALRSFTIWGAYGIFSEDSKGSLEAGKYADFVVIDRDYMTCPESDIKEITAIATVIGGELVYGSLE